MEFYTTIGEMIFYTVSGIAILMLVYSKAEGLFFAPLLLLAIDFTGYIETQQSYAHRFAMEQFKAKGELDCGFLTQQRTLITDNFAKLTFLSPNASISLHFGK